MVWREEATWCGGRSNCGGVTALTGWVHNDRHPVMLNSHDYYTYCL